MSAPALVPPGGGEVVGDSPGRRVEILSEHDALHATWSRYGAGRDGADLHFHRHHTDMFYVLEGELTVLLGAAGEETRVAAGSLARVPPLVVHGFRNGSDAEVRYLNLHAPGAGFASFMRALRDRREHSFDQHPPPPDGERSPADAAIACGDGVLADVEGIRIEVSSPEAGEEHAAGGSRLRALYVLDGELAVDGRRRAGAGTWVQLPPGGEHAVSCSAPARVLDVRVPV